MSRYMVSSAIALALVIGATIPGRLSVWIFGPEEPASLLAWLEARDGERMVRVAVVGIDCEAMVARATSGVRFHWGGVGDRDRRLAEFDAEYLVVPRGVSAGDGVRLVARDLDGFDVYQRDPR